MFNKPNALLLETVALVLCISTLVVTTHSLGTLDLELPDVQRCLSPILGVPGCINELIDGDLRLEPQLVGPPCCKAFLQINQHCWAKLFPMNPGFAPSLKDYCLRLPPPPPPPTTTGAPPVPTLLPQTPPPQSPHKPSPSASPSKPPTSSPHTPPPQSPHNPPPTSSPSKPPAASPHKPPSHTPSPQSPHKAPSPASPQKPTPGFPNIDDSSEA